MAIPRRALLPVRRLSARRRHSGRQAAPSAVGTPGRWALPPAQVPVYDTEGGRLDPTTDDLVKGALRA
ncbi:hypothetical protein ACIG63_44740 [Streptomyces antimycoticus]|uniref:hypothetical protein n=1 Tax=Streptomyces antimycoticus TaxID=68175 RepID=UPI0034108DE1